MERLKMSLSYVYLVFLIFSLTANTISANHDKDHMLYGKYNQTLTLTCNTTTDSAGYEVQWEKDGKPIMPNETRYTVEPHKNSFVIEKLQRSDIGNYTCRLNSSVISDNDVDISDMIRVAVPVNVLKFPVSINHVEGETAKLTCKIVGDPVERIDWFFVPDNESGNRTMVAGDRLKLSDDELGHPDAIWELEDVRMDDRGYVYCVATGPGENNSDKEMVYLRVKDKLAALWPFLGICAEVAVLCTIIFIYEKKRNKTEMEESDTDQSPEQKNTPDHGKDTDVRQRK